MGLNQERFAALGGVKKGAQGLYETGQRAPDASYLLSLSQHGIDIAYILTGQRQAPQESAEISRFVALFTQLSQRERRAVEALVGVLAGASADQLMRHLAGFDGPSIGQIVADAAAGVLHDKKTEFRHEP